MAATEFPSVVTPAVPPRPPQITLAGSAVRPDLTSDPANPVWDVGAEQLAMLPDDLRSELEARRGDSWVRGFAYAPENHHAAVVRDPCDQDSTIDVGENAPIVVVVPYLIVAGDQCSAFGFEERDFKGRALRLLDNATPQAIEAEFWSGTLAQAGAWPNHYLTDSSTLTDVTPGGGPPSVSRGLQLLQDALATCGFGGQGMIHCQPQTAPNLLGARRVGTLLLDIFDNIIVPGVGYPGTGPDGATPDAGTAWIYATDLAAVRIEDEGTVFPDTFAEALDRGQNGEPNTITFYAERYAAAFGDFFCHFGVNVTLPS